MAPGTTGQFTAVADYSDGSSTDVTTSASWQSSAGNILAFTGGGTVMATGPGEAGVTATLQMTSPSQNVLILEPGTFRVSGTVTYSGSPLGGAVVEVVAGIGMGRRATADFSSGGYALYGVAGAVELRVSADGFDTLTRAAVVGGHAVGDFDLHATATPVDIAGAWAVTLTASAACSANLPEDVRQRSYAGLLKLQGPSVQLVLSGATVVSGWIQGTLIGRSLTLDIGWNSEAGGDFYLYERLSPTRGLGIGGAVKATVIGQEIRGTLDGIFTMGTGAPNDNALTCRNGSHEFVLRRP
jgi:hypothetical protein